MSALLALIVGAEEDRYPQLAAALAAEQIEARRATDFFQFTGRIEPELFARGIPALIALLGAPAPVLLACVSGIRGSPAGSSIRLLVYGEGLGLNEKGALLRAGADDCLVSEPSPELFAARARALLKRVAAPAGEGAQGEAARSDGKRRLGPLTLDLVQRSALLGRENLRLTRLQFDLLVELSRGHGEAVAPASLLAGLARRGHALDAESLRARAAVLNFDLVLFGHALDLLEGGYRLVEAAAERRAPVLGLTLLQCLGTLIVNLRLYKPEHAGIVGALLRARELLGELAKLSGSDRIVVSRGRGDRLLVDGRGIDPSIPPPPPLENFLSNFRIGEIRIRQNAGDKDLLGFCRVASLGKGEAYPSQIPLLLAERGVVGVTVAGE